MVYYYYNDGCFLALVAELVILPWIYELVENFLDLKALKTSCKKEHVRSIPFT